MSTAKELGERIKSACRRDGILRKDTEFAIDSLVRLVSLASAEQAAGASPELIGKVVETLDYIVDNVTEIPYECRNRALSLSLDLAASPQPPSVKDSLIVQPPATHKGAMTGWISVEERRPEEGQSVAFVVSTKNSSWEYMHGRVLGGVYTGSPFGGFSVPGLTITASHWMPLPPPPPGITSTPTGDSNG